jgi:hypothetical protein
MVIYWFGWNRREGTFPVRYAYAASNTYSGVRSGHAQFKRIEMSYIDLKLKNRVPG